MIGHILLATDFSPRSDRALRRASMLAKQAGARLSLVHVVDDDQPLHLRRAQVAASRITLEDMARSLQSFDGLEAESAVVTGDSFAGILDAAHERRADLIVLGPHRRRLRDLFAGTTAARTVSRSPLPVLVAAGVPAARHSRAFVALDMAEGSQDLAARFAAMELVEPARAVAIHAFDAPARGMLQRAMTAEPLVEDYLRDERNRASERFRRFLAGTALAAARRRILPLDGTVARTIRDAAREEAAALIVLGTSQRTGIERFMLGSVAEEVLGSAERDVLVIPA